MRKTFKIEKKHSQSRKSFHYREKNFYNFEKKIIKLRKKNYNQEKCFEIEKTILKSTEMFQNWEIFFDKNQDKILNSKTSNSLNLPANICLFRVNNRNTRKRCEICWKLIMKITSMTSCWCFYCWLWTYSTLLYSVSVVGFEQVNVCWVKQDKIRNKRNLLSCVNSTVKFIETKERKTCHRNIK